MDIAIIGQDSEWDRRVPLTPAAAGQLVDAGHRMFVQSGVGNECGFIDDQYAGFGADICHTHDEALRRGRILLSVHAPAVRSLELMQPESVLISFLHLVTASRQYLEAVVQRHLTTIGMEVVSDEHGDEPLYAATSEIAGQIAVYLAAELLLSHRGGKGILLGGATGVHSAKVLVLGAGTVGTAAASVAMRMGARVLLLDRNVAKLRIARRELGPGVNTALSNRQYLSTHVPGMDVVIACARRSSGQMAPVVITDDMVASMAASSVIIDLAMDQGGCVETSRPTTADAPTYRRHGVIHVCLRHITALAARGSSFAISHVLTPYVEELAQAKERYREQSPDLWRGTYTFGGDVISQAIRQRLELRLPSS